ncbi:MAG: hypothetical protein ABI384_05165 [Allobranchiibius sp.]
MTMSLARFVRHGPAFSGVPDHTSEREKTTAAIDLMEKPARLAPGKSCVAQA